MSQGASWQDRPASTRRASPRRVARTQQRRAMRRCGARLLRAALLAALATLAAAGADYYSTLGIARGADDATIKKNYRKLALCVPWARRAARGGGSVARRRRCV